MQTFGWTLSELVVKRTDLKLMGESKLLILVSFRFEELLITQGFTGMAQVVVKPRILQPLAILAQKQNFTAKILA